MLWTGVEVVGVRGSGEWLGVEMGDPVGEEVHELLDKVIIFKDVNEKIIWKKSFKYMNALTQC